MSYQPFALAQLLDADGIRKLLILNAECIVAVMAAQLFCEGFAAINIEGHCAIAKSDLESKK